MSVGETTFSLRHLFQVHPKLYALKSRTKRKNETHPGNIGKTGIHRHLCERLLHRRVGQQRQHTRHPRARVLRPGELDPGDVFQQGRLPSAKPHPLWLHICHFRTRVGLHAFHREWNLSQDEDPVPGKTLVPFEMDLTLLNHKTGDNGISNECQWNITVVFGS